MAPDSAAEIRKALTDPTSQQQYERSIESLRAEFVRTYIDRPDALFAPVRRIANEAVRATVGYNLRPVGTSGSNDTSWLTTVAGVPAMAFGPGGGNAHGADEWTSIEMLVGFAKIYGLMAMEICGVE